MRWIKQIATYFALVAALAPAAHAQSKNVVIAYQDMVVPWRYAQDMKELEKQTGYTVSFRQFGGGGDVIRAMASGQIAIGEAGTSPIASALSQGLDVELFWILDDINAAEAMVARNGSKIASVADLKGKRVACPSCQPRTTTRWSHWSAPNQSEGRPHRQHAAARGSRRLGARRYRRHLYLGSGAGQAQAVRHRADDLRPDCRRHRQGHLRRMIANKKFARENPEFMVKLVRVLAAADDNYRKNKASWTPDSPMVKAVAKVSGAKAETVPASMALYAFPTLQEQVSERWLGGGAARALQSAAQFLKEQGTIQAVLPDYGPGATRNGQSGRCADAAPIALKMAAARKPVWRGRPEGPVAEAHHVQA